MDKAQGLPITFIVIAAVSIMILVLIVGFVMSGKQSMAQGIKGPKAKENCEALCNDLNQKTDTATCWSSTNSDCTADEAIGISDNDGSGEVTGNDTEFCQKTFVVEGKETTCGEMNQECTVEWRDGSQQIVDCSTS